MIVTTTHTKNPAVGWDLVAIAKPDPAEKIARARIIVNGFAEYDKVFDPPISSWQDQLNQQGQYPGDNTVRVIATSDKGDATESIDSWS
jgi:hypothetical protein